MMQSVQMTRKSVLTDRSLVVILIIIANFYRVEMEKKKKFVHLILKSAPDGTLVGRDFENNCEFMPCDGLEDCSQDRKLCPDGSFVSRNPDDECNFMPCPGNDDLCKSDVKDCGDGMFVGRDSSDDCNFIPCPNGCEDESETQCEDGNWVGKNPSDCEDYLPCPEEATPTPIAEPTPTSTLEATPTPTDVVKVCAEDVKECPDGSFVSRDDTNDCKFPQCSEDDFICNDDVKMCR